MAESMAPIVALDNINNLHTDATSTPTIVAAKPQVFNGQLIADDRITNPGVLV